MKKIRNLLIMFLFILTITNVKAENIKIGKINYFVSSEFYCNETRMEFADLIYKIGKIVVYDEDDNPFIWNKDGSCIPYTDQDELDYYNSPYKTIDFNNDNRYVKITKNFRENIGYVVPEKYDSNETYYKVINYTPEIIENVTEENYKNYYIQKQFKHLDTLTLDENVTYYDQGSFNRYFKVPSNELDEKEILNYYVLTNEKEVNTVKVEKTYNITLFNELTKNKTKVYDFVDVDNETYLAIYTGSYGNYTSLDYYDFNGTNIPKYKDNMIFDYEKYVVYYNIIDFKLKVYDKENNNLVYEHTYDDKLMLMEIYYINDMLILYNYTDDDKTLPTYIYKYEVLNGDNQTFNNKDLVIRFNGQFKYFKELKINGKVVPKDNYTVTEGSTIITIDKTYLKELSTGTYEVSAIYLDGGEAYATFFINKEETKKEEIKEEIPETTDNILKNIVIGIVSIICLLTSIIINNKRKMKL